MTDNVTDKRPKLEREVQDALRIERIEMALLKITEDLKKNTESTAELVEAWKSSKWIVAVLKLSAGLVVIAAAANTAWHKLWG